MSSKASTKQQTPTVMPRKTIRGHTDRVTGIVHLPRRQCIITCSWDGTLRLWDMESSAQIGEDWHDGEKNVAVYGMALSPNSKTVVSGSGDGKVKLWDVDTGKVVAKWKGNTFGGVLSVCWSVDGSRVLCGSSHGTARVWDVKTCKTILELETGHLCVYTVTYSPDNAQIATGGFKEGVQIWDAKMGELLAILEHDQTVCSLAWSSTELISASYGPIRIFDTATWEEIAILDGHPMVNAISLSQNNRLLASASDEKVACLWNLYTNLPVGPPLQHEDHVECAAFSADGKVLVTGCDDKNVYVWDVHAILGEAGLQDLLATDTDIVTEDRFKQKASQGEPGVERILRSSLSSNSFLEVCDVFPILLIHYNDNFPSLSVSVNSHHSFLT
ncbi:WD40 repeat-like protein [Suillus decipiens]|nr:WD40 repeat-like protein [Suillus decipiens]